MIAWLFACAPSPVEPGSPAERCGEDPATNPTISAAPPPSGLADVVGVTVSGAGGAATFDVSVRSPDVDCGRYTDWWEVLTPEGDLRYRRILNHSHPDEQPFTRDGGPVPVGLDELVLVRAHLHPDGYGGATMRGCASHGFAWDPEISAAFAATLETTAPLPTECWY